MTLETVVKKFNAKVMGMARDEFAARCINIGVETVVNTPVDTGRLKSNWQFSRGLPKKGERKGESDDGLAAVQELKASSDRLKLNEAFYIVNNLPYAVPIEEGTDKIRPRRMLARAIERAVQS